MNRKAWLVFEINSQKTLPVEHSTLLGAFADYDSANAFCVQKTTDNTDPDLSYKVVETDLPSLPY